MVWKIVLTNSAGTQTTERRVDRPLIRFGREAGNEVVINHPRVSRLHCSLIHNSGRNFLRDSSRNGVMLGSGNEWNRVSGEIGILTPIRLLLPDWTVDIDWIDERPQAVTLVPRTAAPPPKSDSPEPQPEEQHWDQSVIIPAGRLKQRKEAVLVFDLCESSIIASKDDHMAYHLKSRLSQIAEPLLAEHRRRFFKSTGDGFLATFDSCGSALKATVELEDRIQQRNQRTQNTPIHYRLALHFGDTWEISAGAEDIHGHDVNVTFRIEGVQAPSFTDRRAEFPARDRILCSDDFLVALRRETGSEAGYRFIGCGTAALKGIDEPVAIHWIATRYSDQNTLQTALK